MNKKAQELATAALKVANTESHDLYEAQRIIERAISENSASLDPDEPDPDIMMGLAALRRTHKLLMELHPALEGGNWTEKVLKGD